MIICVVGIFYVVMNMAISSGRAELEKRQEELDKVNEQIADEENRTLELEELRIRVETMEYIEERARKLGLVYPDEILFKPR
ncbi:MAG: septum formation initiator family protein [Lachnospiraceae bacterium]|nr:septum formation initiator family protein [Lachnospiraceae bacterium]